MGKEKLWIESISVEEGKLPLLEYHQERMRRTVSDHFPGVFAPDLHAISIPEFARNGWYKCRVLYDSVIRSVDWKQYRVKDISRLKIREAPELEYQYKWADRAALHRLIRDTGAAEDVLITQRGMLKDTSYANILCFDGSEFWTPEEPLLKGTRRAYLLELGMIRTAQLSIEDLDQFKYIRLINAMMGLEMGPCISVDQIN